MGILSLVMLASGAHASDAKFVFRMPGKMVVASVDNNQSEAVFEASNISITPDFSSRKTGLDRTLVVLQFTAANNNNSSVSDTREASVRLTYLNRYDQPAPEISGIQYIYRQTLGFPKSGETVNSYNERILPTGNAPTGIKRIKIDYYVGSEFQKTEFFNIPA